MNFAGPKNSYDLQNYLVEEFLWPKISINIQGYAEVGVWGCDTPFNFVEAVDNSLAHR